MVRATVFVRTFGVDHPIINGDQMPLHRNESSDQRTLAFKHLDTYVTNNSIHASFNGQNALTYSQNSYLRGKVFE